MTKQGLKLKHARLAARKRNAGPKDRRRPDRRAQGKPGPVSDASEATPDLWPVGGPFGQPVACGMTVGEIREALVGAHESWEVTVRATRDDGNAITGAICDAGIELSHCDEDTEGRPRPFFAIDVSDHLETIREADAARKRVKPPRSNLAALAAVALHSKTAEGLTDADLRALFAAHCACRPIKLDRDERDHATIHDCDTAILSTIQAAREFRPGTLEWRAARVACASYWNEDLTSDIYRPRLEAALSQTAPAKAEPIGPEPPFDHNGGDTQPRVAESPAAPHLRYHQDRRTTRATPALTLTFEVEREADGRILIEIPELVGATAHGSTLTEAFVSVLRDAELDIREILEGALAAELHLKPMHSYRARNGAVWLCFKVDPEAPRWKQALCIEPTTHTIRPFFIDGRHDAAGKDSSTLIEELPL